MGARAPSPRTPAPADAPVSTAATPVTAAQAPRNAGPRRCGIAVVRAARVTRSGDHAPQRSGVGTGADRCAGAGQVQLDAARGGEQGLEQFLDDAVQGA